MRRRLSGFVGSLFENRHEASKSPRDHQNVMPPLKLSGAMASVMVIAGADCWCEAACADRSRRMPQCIDDNDRSHSDSTDPWQETSMLSKVNFAAVAVLLVASVAPTGAYPQSHDYGTSMPGQSTHREVRVPANARGSVVDSGVFPGPAVRSGGRWFETDPDPRIRFEMNRDDRDRRAHWRLDLLQFARREKTAPSKDEGGLAAHEALPSYASMCAHNIDPRGIEVAAHVSSVNRTPDGISHRE
jgi:hypothetical protein